MSDSDDARDDARTPREKLLAVMDELGLVVESRFVPWSRSRSYDPDVKDVMKKNLNWVVTVLRTYVGSDGKMHSYAVLETEYSAGIGHAPSYPKHPFNGPTIFEAEMLEWEVERGTRAIGVDSAAARLGVELRDGKKPILSDPADVIHSLVSDSDVIDYSSFEEWAEGTGYDPDSRKAERVYRDCLRIALQLRSAVGDVGLGRLREAGQDY